MAPRTDIVGIDIACHARNAIKDLPEPVEGPGQMEIDIRVANAVRAVLDQARKEARITHGGMDDADVISTLKEAQGKGMDLREHDDFPFRLAARYGRTEVMKFLYSDKRTRPSKEAIVFALTDALDAGHLEAARFAGKLVLSGVPALMRRVDELAAEKKRLSDEAERHYKARLESEERVRALAMEIDMREQIVSDMSRTEGEGK